MARLRASMTARLLLLLHPLHSRDLLLHASRARLATDCQFHRPPQEEDMDVQKAVKILFSPRPTRKKFGLDFHLWQFFVACLPPFAVYLTAQYARSEMRRLEEERERSQKEAQQQAEAAQDSVDTPMRLTNEREDNDQSKKGTFVVVDPNELKALTARVEVMEKIVKELERTSVKDGCIFSGAVVGTESEKQNDGARNANYSRGEDVMIKSDKRESGRTNGSAQMQQSSGYTEERRIGQKDLQVIQKTQLEHNKENSEAIK